MDDNKKYLEFEKQIDSMNLLLSQLPSNELYGAAEFWKELGEKHKQLLYEYGFSNFKQTVNFNYIQWGVYGFSNPIIRKLIVDLIKKGKIPYGFLFMKYDKDKIFKGNKKIDLKAYSMFLGLLWQCALLTDKLDCLKVCEEPAFGNPLPFYYKNQLISQDLATSVIELNRIHSLIDLNKIKNIAEIGSGYGRLAFTTVKRFPNIRYSLFDIPPAVVVGQNYLSEIFGEDFVNKVSETTHYSSEESPSKISVYLPHQLEDFPNNFFDLIINISSFDEMSEKQQENYLTLIDSKCNGFFYIRGHKVVPSWCNCSGGGLEQIKYKKHWTLIYSGDDPISYNWCEKLFYLNH